ncbi:hypothetical protein C8A00DRAFT_15949 [Chaetomidium leptoderma]|uniref:RNA-binding protein n=1 Tax=Chaetomidium leptoderma TaxID=669021 RepID=A0AAN6VK80_9PEZI|nr:hypothetical protein C8A00DRAFT_15949 [Chaetomidium leptoderma]
MLFPEEDSPHLKSWIVKRLENTSDADPEVLADYVLALLRHDGDIHDVRKLCEAEMPDFLQEDSPVFVSDVFEAIAYRSYLPGAPPPPSKHALLPTPNATGQLPTSLYYDDSHMGSAPTYPPRFQNGSRKRAYNDWDDPNAQNGRDAGFGGRPIKQPRRGGRGGSRPDDFRGGAPAGFPYLGPGQLQPQQGPPGPSTVGYFDPKGAMDAMFGMSLAAGHSMPDLLRHLPSKKRKKCRDWEKKGYCQRGSNCSFAHSNDPVYPPLPGLPFGNYQPLPQPTAVEGTCVMTRIARPWRIANLLSEYDPTNALMPDLFSGPGPLPGLPPMPDFGKQPRHRGGKHQNRQRRPERAPFSADGPVYDRTKSTIVVENIPEENFDEEQVKIFFSQFGKIAEVSMQPYKRLAIVKFEAWNAANAAYHSPNVIFDNRFVKVFWHKDDGPLSASASTDGGTSAAKRAHPINGSSAASGTDAGPLTEIDMEEFAKQQEEKQKAFEEKTKKREDLERQHEEIEKRQKELIAKQLEERVKLEAKLGGRNGSKSEDNDGGSKKPTTQTEALRAQLAALEAEARQMGLDPDAVDAPAAPWPARGGYGRGRGGWRGATSPYTPRGSFRGGYRGQANVHAAYAAYSLDNRPKKVVLTGVDFTVSEKDETLRQYLFGIGEFTDIRTTPASTEITFKDRKTAEKFFNSVLLTNKEIPGIDVSPVELAWGGANGSSGSVPTTPGGNSKHVAGTPHTNKTKTTTTTTASVTGVTSSTAGSNMNHKKAITSNGDHDDDDDDDAGSSSDKDVHILLERPQPNGGSGGGGGGGGGNGGGGGVSGGGRHDQNEMDYEVADEEQWGY